MTTEQHSAAPRAKQTVGWLAYAIGGASFIPLIGVVFGIIAIVWGILRRVRSLIVLGVGGILFTIVLYSALFYFGFYQRGGIFDKLRSYMAVTMLNSAVKEVEYYKLQHGHYPNSLRDLVSKDPNNSSTFIDPTFVERKGTNDSCFFYELDASGTSYFLRSVGPDGIPFTADDILPTISEEERKHTGLKLER
jgi:type II secretion system (T2SS) protein G